MVSKRSIVASNIWGRKYSLRESTNHTKKKIPDVIFDFQSGRVCSWLVSKCSEVFGTPTKILIVTSENRRYFNDKKRNTHTRLFDLISMDKTVYGSPDLPRNVSRSLRSMADPRLSIKSRFENPPLLQYSVRNLSNWEDERTFRFNWRAYEGNICTIHWLFMNTTHFASRSIGTKAVLFIEKSTLSYWNQISGRLSGFMP